MFSLKKFLNKEWNITIKPVVSLWFYPFFNLFSSYCQIHQTLSISHVCVCVCVWERERERERERAEELCIAQYEK